MHPCQDSIPRGIPGGFFIYNALDNEEIIFADPNVIRLFGCESMEEFRDYVGNSFRGMIHPDDVDEVESDIMAQTFKSGKRHDYVRYRIITKQGDIRYLEDFGHLLHTEDGKAYYYAFVIDLEKYEYSSEARKNYAAMKLFSNSNKYDRITGLLDISAFFEKAQDTALNRPGEEEQPSTVVVFDILGLREVNHTLGREEGDSRIRVLVDDIRRHMPDGCFLFRGYEGEIIAVCRNRAEQDVMENVLAVTHACKSSVLFGIGSTGGCADNPFAEGNGTLLQALEEAQTDLRFKKMLNPDSSRSQALASLMRALEEVDADTEEHVLRTQKMGTALGRKIGLSDAQLTTLQLLCLLHDIGKITVPLEILNKPGKLNDPEWATLHAHADKGYQIAMASDELKPIAELIRHHHERWDGNGYPAKLAKEEIPILSRVISIVDAYDAMVNDRAYRNAMMPEKAKKEIRDNAGTQFDPYLAEEFLNMLEENPMMGVGEKTGTSEVRVFRQGEELDTAAGNTSAVLYTKYSLDIDDTIIEIDDYFEKMTGYSRNEVIGKMTQFDLIPPEDKEQYIAHVKKQFVKGDIAYLRHRILCKNGDIIQVICNGERYYDSSVRAFRSTLLVYEV